ncbi:MAG: holo-[acyl-carrier-protein] synthase [Clostridiales bacterium]|nr:holo-[acyl-carrier-protein] synthase [Clostridiales bacterium]
MIGVDILEVSRLKKALLNEVFVKRILTQQEIEYVKKYKDCDSHITGFFCAKEAVMKALEDCHDISFKEIEILHKQTGKPYVKLYGKAQKIFDEKGYSKLEISISQTNTIAIAFCQIS